VAGGPTRLLGSGGMLFALIVLALARSYQREPKAEPDATADRPRD
jgi:hypothetical protein